MIPLCFSMPWPPSVNRIWRVSFGRIVLSAAARKYKRDAAASLPVGRVTTLREPVAVWLTYHPPASLAGRRWDVANREKLLVDTLVAQRVLDDDHLIDFIAQQRGAAAAGCGRVDVMMWKYAGPL